MMRVIIPQERGSEVQEVVVRLENSGIAGGGIQKLSTAQALFC
jgi:hypothetical protein